MAVITWRADVNRTILDDANGTVGENAVKKDNFDSGFEQSYASSLANPDKISVTMDFNWEEKDANNLSEFDRFINWYKYKHEFGANPFWFESITKFNVNGPRYNKNGQPIMCQYKIDGPINWSKSGFCMRVKMTWKEVYSGVIQIANQELTVDRIEAENGKMFIIFNQALEDLPSPTKYIFNYKSLDTELKGTFSPYRITAEYNVSTFYVDDLPAGKYEISLNDEYTVILEVK